MRSDDNHGVLFLVEQDTLDLTGHHADLGAVFAVVSEAHRARVATKEEEGVDILLLVLVHHEGAEHNVRDGAVLLVLAHGSHATVRAPHANCAVDVTGDHAGAIVAKGDFGDGRVVNTLNIIKRQGVIQNLNIFRAGAETA